ncbi:carbohydrate kinase family protein [Armatimonas sp.]|uniref:carbohydrate kinase family protein n=1 Tax=Armatimonas sp. TaxID=1872638 RepID=UPI003752C8B2
MNAPDRVDIVVYGTVALDRFSPSGRELPGGEALNTACLLAGWGVSVALVGTAIGRDPEGVRLRDLIEATGLSRAFIPDDPDAVTPVCDIVVSPNGERTMSGRGFAQAIAPPVPEALFTSRPIRPIVAVDPNLGLQATQTALAAAQAGCPLIAMDFAHQPDVVAVAEVLQCSLESLRRFGGPTGEPEEIVAALPARTALLTLGAEGGIVQTQGRITRYRAYPLTDVCDTTGAGDAFRAGLCYSRLQNWPLERTLYFASATAACHCRRLGGASQVPLEEIHDLMAKNPVIIF